MSIALKNGSVILKNGRLAETCTCCGSGFSCSCAAPSQMQIEFANSTIQSLATVVVTQAAYTAAFGSQIADVQMGTFDANSPYPNQPFFGVAGYLYDFVYVDPVLGAAPAASSLQGNCDWAGKNNLLLRVSALFQLMRRQSSETAEGFGCFYLYWSYSQVGVDQSCNLAGWGASSGWSVIPNGGGNNPYIFANFANKSAGPCCIATNTDRVGRSLTVNGVAGFQGSARMTVLDCV